MIDIRTLLFANAVVFAVLAIAMILVWRGNPRLPGLASLARVHATMIPGAALIGLSPAVVPAFLSAALGNALTVLSLLWLLEGIGELYGRTRDRWPRMALIAWGAGLLGFQYVQPSLRGRIFVTSFVSLVFLLRAAWTACDGVRKPGERAPSLLILGSLGLLAAVFAVRCVFLATNSRVMSPVGSDISTLALVTVSLVAATGWTFGVMNLVYARLNAELSREVAERKRYEKALEELVRVAAHELRSPLTSIYGTLQLLSYRGIFMSNEDKERLLAVARRNSERMVHLINDLLDLERVESGGASFAISPLDLERELEQARELSEGFASQCEVAIELAPLPQVRVCADPKRLQQVLANLLSNAVKFSPQGESVRVSASQRDGMIRVEVSDRGPGIPLELRDRIFQRFARGTAPGTSREHGTGTGLGLAISKALIERMGGRIGFDSSETTGTTFYFELPAEAG